MNKNICLDIKRFFSNRINDILIVFIPAGVMLITKIFSEVNPFLLYMLLLLGIVIFIPYFFIRKWRIKTEKGILIVNPYFDKIANEKRKRLWLEIKTKNEFDRVKVDLILKRFTVGDKLMGGDLMIGKQEKCFLRDFETSFIPRKVDLANGIDDEIHILLADDPFPLKILLTDKQYENYLSENYEIVIEIIGKINDEYNFSELFCGGFQYICTKEPNVFVGQEAPLRMSQLKWEYFSKWSPKQETDREIERLEANKKALNINYLRNKTS